MSAYKPSGAYCVEFVCSLATGAASDADALPVATVNKNGTDDGSSPTGWSNTLTVAKIDTGRYKITGTIPSGYASGDVVNVSVAATISSVAAKAVVDTFIVDTKRNSDLNDAAALIQRSEPPTTAQIVTAMQDTGTQLKALHDVKPAYAPSVDSSGRVTVVSNADKTGYTVSTVSDKTGYSLSVTPPTTTDIVTAILSTPANKLATDGSGRVTVATNADKTGYALTTTPPTTTEILSAVQAAGTHLTLIKAQTDQLVFADGKVNANATVTGGDATAANQTTIINHLTAIKGATFSGTTDSLEAIRDRGDAAWIAGGSGSGAIEYSYTLTSGTSPNPPIADALVWVTTDSAGNNTVASGRTDAFGNVTFFLNAGTYYFWRQKSGWNFINPDTETVTS